MSINNKLGSLRAKLPEGIRNLNGKPLYIALGIFAIVAASIVFSISSKNKKPELEENTSIKIDTTTQVEDIDKLFAEPTETNSSTDLNLTDLNNTAMMTPQPVAEVAPELSPEEEERRRLMLERLKMYHDANYAPTSIEKTNSTASGVLSNPLDAASNVPNSLIDNIKSVMNASGVQSQQEQSKNKNEDFLEKSKKSYDYLPYQKTAQMSPYELKTGSVIPGVLISGINSQLPGLIIAQVSDNVYDSATGKHMLIPQGTRIVGTYSADVSYGQNRALVAWNRLVFPGGKTLNIEAMNGADQAGFAGFSDRVNNHYFRIFSSAFLISLIGGEISFNNGKFSVNQQSNTSTQTTVSQVGNTMLNKNLEVAPTIEIRPGYQFNIFVTKDMILEPLQRARR